MQAIQDPQAAQYDEGAKFMATVGIMWRGGGDSPPQQPDDLTLTTLVTKHLRWDQIGGCCLMVLSRVRPEPVLGHLNHAFRFNQQMFPEPLWGSRIPTLAEGISAGAVGTGSQRKELQALGFNESPQ